MSRRLAIALLFVLAAVPGLAVDIPTPEGYEPWFLVDGSWVEPQIIIRPASESLPDWQAVTAVVVASNPELASVPSDPSTETMILPPGVTVAPGWTGPTITKTAAGVVGVTFTQGTGTVSRYTVFRKLRVIYGACGKPGTPGVVP